MDVDHLMIRLHPGQLDPTDPSRCTIGWKANDKYVGPAPSGVLDLQLVPDGSAVKVTVHPDPPAKSQVGD
jgi:hypothetical protein